MRKKYALCVGINDYPGTNADLRGCVNDAQDWASTLHDQGYDVEMLLDSAATKTAMREALQRLVGKAGMGDRIVFTYSGHGTWVPDRDGDEIDKRDEALVCYDYQRGGLLTDDELHGIFGSRKRGTRATIVSDSCHSGTMQRFIATARHADSRPRFMSPAELGLVDRQDAVEAERVAPPSRSRPGTILVSGCQDNEVSYDAYIGGRYRGAMTAAALKVLHRKMTVRSFRTQLHRELPSSSFPQTPTVVGSRSQERLSLF